MVRQASCDVSDRNDKGSPDTVWQILGSYCGSFSCSKTSAAQTQDPAPASRKETLQSESGKALPSARKVSSPCFSPREPQTRAPVHKRAGLLGSRTQQVHGHLGTPVGPKHEIRGPPSTAAGAALLRLALTQAHTSNGRAKMLLSVPSSRKARNADLFLTLLNRNLSSRGSFKATQPPSRGEEAPFSIYACSQHWEALSTFLSKLLRRKLKRKDKRPQQNC